MVEGGMCVCREVEGRGIQVYVEEERVSEEDVRLWECEDVRLWECEEERVSGDVRLWECEDVRLWE